MTGSNRKSRGRTGQRYNSDAYAITHSLTVDLLQGRSGPWQGTLAAAPPAGRQWLGVSLRCAAERERQETQLS